MFGGNINCRSAPTAGLIAAGTAALSERLGSTAGSSTGDVDCRLTKRRNILAAGYLPALHGGSDMASMTTTQKTYLHIIQELENKDIDIVMRSLSELS